MLQFISSIRIILFCHYLGEICYAVQICSFDFLPVQQIYSTYEFINLASQIRIQSISFFFETFPHCLNSSLTLFDFWILFSQSCEDHRRHLT